MEQTELLTEETEIEETMILGLRMMKGVSKKEFYHKYKKNITDIYGDIIRKYVKMGLMEENSHAIKLTEQGISVSNVILSDFLLM